LLLLQGALMDDFQVIIKRNVTYERINDVLPVFLGHKHLTVFQALTRKPSGSD
jgi:hypothetical protein